jgi:polysaccharide export outer membrane protein
MIPKKYVLIFVIFLGLFLCSVSLAEEYTIGPEDVLTITFWQQPELNTVAVVKQDGKIALPVVGEMTVAGLTTSELSAKIVERISFYNKNISQATVIVTQYNSRKVLVQGQVLSPGKYGFEKIPNLWEVIREAGGPTELADLGSVTIVRGGEEAGKMERVNLDKYLRQGDLSKLPQLKPGDTINIPRLSMGVPSDVSATTQFQGKEIYYIYGQVGRAGVYPLSETIDLLDAIVLAGGTTPSADMKRVKVIAKGERYSQVISVNMDKYINQGNLPRYMIKPEDTIIVPVHGYRGFAKIWPVVRDLMPITTAIASLYLLIDNLHSS